MSTSRKKHFQLIEKSRKQKDYGTGRRYERITFLRNGKIVSGLFPVGSKNANEAKDVKEERGWRAALDAVQRRELNAIKNVNVANIIEKWHDDQIKNEYIKLLKDYDDTRRRIDLARTERLSATEVTALNKKHGALRTKISYVKKGADVRRINLEKHIEEEKKRLKQKRKQAETESTEEIQSYLDENGNIVLTERGIAALTVNEPNLTDEERDALERFIRMPVITHETVAVVEPIAFPYAYGEYFGGYTIDRDGNKVPHGMGKWSMTSVRDGSTVSYEGSFSTGTYHGNGVLQTVDADGKIKNRYEGTFANNKFEGRGDLQINTESTKGEINENYSGTFKNGLYHGTGELLVAHENGEETHYKGNFAGGKYDGAGTLTKRNGHVYDGAFKNGLPHGLLTHYDDMGNYERGVWVDGNRVGRFEFTKVSNDGTEKTEVVYYDSQSKKITAAQYDKLFNINSNARLTGLGFRANVDENNINLRFPGFNMPKLNDDITKACKEAGIEIIGKSISCREGENTMHFAFQFKSADGAQGKIERSFTRNSNGELNVEHNYMIVPGTTRGRGTGRKLMRALSEQYDKMGVDTVSVTASLTEGGYSWACYGFNIDGGSSKVLREYFGDSSRAQKLRDDLGEAAYVRLKRTIEEWPQLSPFPMNILSDIAGKSGKAGKNLLRGTTWRGKVNWKDAAQTATWRNYIDDDGYAARKARLAKEQKQSAADAPSTETRERGRRTNYSGL